MPKDSHGETFIWKFNFKLNTFDQRIYLIFCIWTKGFGLKHFYLHPQVEITSTTVQSLLPRELFLITFLILLEYQFNNYPLKFDNKFMTIGFHAYLLQLQVSFFIPPDIVPARIVLLVTLCLVLINMFNSTT